MFEVGFFADRYVKLFNSVMLELYRAGQKETSCGAQLLCFAQISLPTKRKSKRLVQLQLYASFVSQVPVAMFMLPIAVMLVRCCATTALLSALLATTKPTMLTK